MLNPKPNNVTEGSNSRDTLQLGIELKAMSSHTQSYVHNKLLLPHLPSMDQLPWYSFKWTSREYESAHHSHKNIRSDKPVSQLSIVLAGVTVFRTWFGAAKLNHF